MVRWEALGRVGNSCIWSSRGNEFEGQEIIRECDTDSLALLHDEDTF